MRLVRPSAFYVLTALLAAAVLQGAGCARYKSKRVLFQIGGTTSGLSGKVILTNNGGDDLSISENGSFAFPTFLQSGISYDVAVKVQPAAQTCVVANGQGTTGGEENVTNVTVSCGSSFSLGGTVNGLLNGTLVLQNNGGDDLNVTADGAFTFANVIADGSDYSVTVKTQPEGLICSAANSSGQISGHNVTNVHIQCASEGYSVGGTVSGLSGTLVLQNNSGDDLTITANGSFTFATMVADMATYVVTVKTQPAAQSCSLANATGTIDGAAATNITISCSANTHTVGGSVSSLNGTVVLQNNGGDDKSISTNGSFTFDTAIAAGGTYAVTVLTQPADQTCTVTGGNGTVTNNVTNVSVSCANNAYTIGGTVDGLSGTVVLQNNAGDDLTVNADGDFTFDSTIVSGGTYVVTVLTQPAGQYCLVTNGSGTASGNVTNIDVECSEAKIIKLSATTVNGAMGGAPADAAAAMGLADALCDPGYLAMIASSVRQPPSTDWVLAPDTHYVRATGEYIGTTTANAVFTFPLSNTISPNFDWTWTGLRADWTVDLTCSNWTATVSSGMAGNAGLAASNAVRHTAVACTQLHSLYCVEQ